MTTALTVTAAYLAGAATTAAIILAPGLRDLTPTQRDWIKPRRRAR